MNPILRNCLAALYALLVVQSLFAQDKNNLTKEATMETQNAVAIRNLYEVILNERKLELLDNLISEKYTNTQGGVGVNGFKKGIIEVLHAFEDAQWVVEELMAQANKVMVRQRLLGTHTGHYQGISPTGISVNSEGFGIYEFENGKIINHLIQTDRLGFLQQLGALPKDISTLTQSGESTVFFIDKFIIPNDAMDLFINQMQYNRAFIMNLSGFITDYVLSRQAQNGNLELVTVAVWKDQKSLDNAKNLVQEEYKRIGFNPHAFLQELSITMERQQYSAYE